MTEAAKAWQDYARFSTTLQGRVVRKVSTVYLDTGATKDYVAAESVIRQNDHCAMVATARPASNTPTLELCNFANASYAVQVLRDRAKPESAILKDFNADANGQLSATALRVRDSAFYELSPHYSYDGRRLPDLINLGSSQFRITSLESVVRDGKAMIRVGFAHDFDKNAKSTVGSLTFAPDLHWCIHDVKESVTMAYGVVDREIVYEFDINDTGFPIVRRQFLTSTGPTRARERVKNKVTYEYAIHSDPSVSDQEFTLTNYGLPEPQSTAAVKSRSYLLYIGLAALSAIIGALLRLRARATKSTWVTNRASSNFG